MKRLFLLLNIILAISISNAQETYRFRTDAPQGLSIERSTPTGLSLHYSVPEIGIANIDNGEAKGQEIILKGSFGSFAEGLPNLPFENRYIAVPKGATVSIEVKERASKTLNGIELLPAAEVQLNTDKGLPKLRKDMKVFGKDANFPSENVSIAQTTQIRNLDVVLLNVTPFRYNPVRKTLEVIYDMDIEVCPRRITTTASTKPSKTERKAANTSSSRPTTTAYWLGPTLCEPSGRNKVSQPRWSPRRNVAATNLTASRATSRMPTRIGPSHRLR